MSERGRDPIGYDADKFERLLRDPMEARPLAEKPGIDPGDALAALSICGLSGNYGAKGEPLACAYRRGHDGDHAWASLPTFVDGVRHTFHVPAEVVAALAASGDAPREGLDAATLEGIFDHDGHTEMCARVRYPGGPFEPPDPCTCGGDDVRAALASAAEPGDPRWIPGTTETWAEMSARLREQRGGPVTSPDVWSGDLAPGGYVCGECGQPTESEPCAEHQAGRSSDVAPETSGLREAAARLSDAYADWAASGHGPRIDVMDDEGMAYFDALKALRKVLWPVK